jgi:hypothetical protein
MRQGEIQEMPRDWREISDDTMQNFLFGNGLGRMYWDKFAYRSLLESFGDSPVGRYLCTKELFSKLRTENFEEVLRAIYHAYHVSIDNQDATKTLYLDVQKALISAVNLVHPKPADIPSERIGQCLSDYNAIFTTNYDLLPYWAILSGWSNKLVDFFWEDGVFNIRNVEVFSGKSPLYFLHGALHLQSVEISDARKVPLSFESGAVGAFESGFVEKFPLFITEGKSELKLNRIRSNSYLNFCYENLRKSKGGMVVFGHELSQEYDGHIVEALRESSNDTIAISVFSGMDAPSKRKFMGRVAAQFSDLNKKIIFYESASHPIAQCGS